MVTEAVPSRTSFWTAEAEMLAVLWPTGMITEVGTERRVELDARRTVSGWETSVVFLVTLRMVGADAFSASVPEAGEMESREDSSSVRVMVDWALVKPFAAAVSWTSMVASKSWLSVALSVNSAASCAAGISMELGAVSRVWSPVESVTERASVVRALSRRMVNVRAVVEAFSANVVAVGDRLSAAMSSSTTLRERVPEVKAVAEAVIWARESLSSKESLTGVAATVVEVEPAGMVTVAGMVSRGLFDSRFTVRGSVVGTPLRVMVSWSPVVEFSGTEVASAVTASAALLSSSTTETVLVAEVSPVAAAVTSTLTSPSSRLFWTSTVKVTEAELAGIWTEAGTESRAGVAEVRETVSGCERSVVLREMVNVRAVASAASGMVLAGEEVGGASESAGDSCPVTTS